MLFALATILNP